MQSYKYVDLESGMISEIAAFVSVWGAAPIGGNATVNSNVTVLGAVVNDDCRVSAVAPGTTPGLVLSRCFVPVADTVTVSITNCTIGALAGGPWNAWVTIVKPGMPA